jgi:ABC-type transporter Mla MlaB component
MTEVAGDARAEPLRLTDCTVGNIESLHTELVSRLWGAGPVAIDRSDVRRANTAMLQLVAAFVRDLRSQSRSVEWCGQSSAFDRGAQSLGLTASLGLPTGEG